MTVKEFSEKYQIPYNIVYKATYIIKPYPSFRTDYDYKEEELKRETLRYANSRLKTLKRQCEQYETALRNMTENL